MITIDEFARMAEENPEEAFELFSKPDFAETLESEGADDPRPALLHRGLGVPGCGKEAMEEFLLAAGCKKPVTVAPEKGTHVFFDVREARMERITLRRSGWGSLSVRAEARGDFIELMKNSLTDEDFVGRTASIAFVIRADRLGTGIRRGKILLKLPDGTAEVEITASAGKEGRIPEEIRADRLGCGITKRMTDWKLGRIRDEKLAGELEGPLGELSELLPEKKREICLLAAFAAGISGRYAEEKRYLRGISGKKNAEDPLDLAEAFLLQVAGLCEESRTELAEEAERIRRHYPENYAAFYLSTNLSYALHPSVRRKMRAARECFEAGNRSPLLYADVLREFREDPLLLMKLDDFSIQVLFFAVRENMLTEDLLLRAAYLAENEKEFRPALFHILSEGYRAFPSDAALTAVVRLQLLKDEPDRRDFSWYDMAVERDVRIRGLYERYVETLPENRTEVLPLVIRIYFVYNQTLTDAGRAALYANLARNRRKDPDTFEAVRDRIAEFAVRELEKGVISEDLAVISGEVRPRPSDEKSAEALAALLTTERFYIDDPGIVRVHVLHPELDGELVFPVTEGNALIRRVSDDALVIPENRDGVRFVVSREYLTEPFPADRELLELCREMCPDNAELLLMRALEFDRLGIEDAEDFRLRRRIAEHAGFSAAYRRDARRRVLRYVDTHPENSFFTARTPAETLSAYADADGDLLLRVLMGGGLFREAFSVAEELGFEGLSPERLARLASRMIDGHEEEADAELLECASYVFRRGKYDEHILSYLVRFFEGSLEELLELRGSAARFLLPSEPLDERILARSFVERRLFREIPEVLRSFVQSGGRKRILRQWLEFYCGRMLSLAAGSHEPLDTGDAMAGGKKEGIYPDDYAASCMKRLIEEEGPRTDPGVKLCWLLYASGRDALTPEEREFAGLLLGECLSRNLRFGFFRDLPEDLVRAFRLRGRVFVEYAGDAADEVSITWRIVREETDGTENDAGKDISETETASAAAEAEEERGDGGWHREPVARRFRGIYVREFTLFGGEYLEYELEAERNGTVWSSGRKRLSAPKKNDAGNSRFARINRMLELSGKEDWDGLREEMREYRRALAAAERLFAPEGGL